MSLPGNAVSSHLWTSQYSKATGAKPQMLTAPETRQAGTSVVVREDIAHPLSVICDKMQPWYYTT